MHPLICAGDILAFGSDISVRNRHYNFQEFLGCYERLATFQAKAARQERIKVRKGLAQASRVHVPPDLLPELWGISGPVQELWADPRGDREQ